MKRAVDLSLVPSLSLALLVAAGCARVPEPLDDPTPGSTVELEILELCETVWPADECEGGCATTPVEETFEAAFHTFLDASSHASAESTQLLQLGVEAAQQSSFAEYQWYVDVDWIRIQAGVYASGDGGEPTEPYIVNQLGQYDWLPNIDPDVDMISYADAVAEVAACEAELGVTFQPRGWCTPAFSQGTAQPHFELRFWADDWAQLNIDLFGARPADCWYQGPVGR